MLIHNSQDMETTKMPINIWLHKESMVHIIYTMEFYSVTKENNVSFASKQMELEVMIGLNIVHFLFQTVSLF